MESGIIKMVVQILWVKTGLFVRLASTLKPFTILTQYCYVNYLHCFQKVDDFLQIKSIAK